MNELEYILDQLTSTMDYEYRKEALQNYIERKRMEERELLAKFILENGFKSLSQRMKDL